MIRLESSCIFVGFKASVNCAIKSATTMDGVGWMGGEIKTEKNKALNTNKREKDFI